MSREMRTALGLQLTGAVLALLAAGRPWVEALVEPPPPLPARAVELTGGQLGSPSRALALVALAGVVAVLGARGLLRAAVGAVVALCGGLLVADALRVLLDRDGVLLARGLFLQRPELTVWPLLLALAGVLVLVAGLLVTARGRRWAALSARYDAPAARGTDPAAGSGGSAAGEGPLRSSVGAVAGDRPGAAAPEPPTVDDRATAGLAWDALDRGEDPTREAR